MDHQEEQQYFRRSTSSENQDSGHQPPQPEKCPRCNSLNTKFCYYNNYNQSQPRYFCKTCRRYWTHGGTLRNVPVGGGCRKVKRPRSAASTSSPTRESSKSQPLPPPLLPPQLPTNLTYPTPSSGLFPFTQQQGINQNYDLIGGLGIFQGFNFPLFKSHLDQPLQIQLDNELHERDDEEKNGESLYREQARNLNLTSNVNIWNSPSESTTSDGMPSSSLNANQWPNLPGFRGPL